MGLKDEHKPTYMVHANRSDITETIAKYFAGLSLTDATGFECDTLEITLEGEGIQKPARGAELELWLGHPGSLTKMGLFVVDEIGLKGWPTALTIRARGTPFKQSKVGGLSGMQSQKTRAWKRGLTIDKIVAKIASEHKLQSLISRSLKGIELPHYDQIAESDLALLVRIGQRYDAVVKPGGGKLALFRRGDFENMPTFRIDAPDAGPWNYTETSRDTHGTVVAFWHSKRNSRRHQVTVGSGEPVKQLRMWYPDEASAKAAAQADLNRRKRGSATFTCTVPGNPKLSAECGLKPAGFHPDLPETFIITRVTHRLDKAGGYTCDVESELPND